MVETSNGTAIGQKTMIEIIKTQPFLVEIAFIKSEAIQEQTATPMR